MESNHSKLFTLITGASAGLGKQFAVESAKRGMNLFLVSLPESGLEIFSEELKKSYPVEVHTLSIDLTQKEAPQQVFEYAQKEKLAVNILINNAGLGFNGKMENLTVGLIDTMILLNVRATTLLSFLFIPEMKKLGKAYILNISSFGSLAPIPHKSVYAASKSYLHFLTQALQEELKDTGIMVTSIHPLGIKSERALPNIKKSGLFARITAMNPEQIVKVSLDEMFSGNNFLVPGFMPKIYYYLGLIMPHGIILNLVKRIFVNPN